VGTFKLICSNDRW